MTIEYLLGVLSAAGFSEDDLLAAIGNAGTTDPDDVAQAFAGMSAGDLVAALQAGDVSAPAPSDAGPSYDLVAPTAPPMPSPNGTSASPDTSAGDPNAGGSTGPGPTTPPPNVVWQGAGQTLQGFGTTDPSGSGLSSQSNAATSRGNAILATHLPALKRGNAILDRHLPALARGNAILANPNRLQRKPGR